MKLALKLVAGVVVLLVVAVVVIMFAIDAVARSAIERGATYALGVQTTLGSADVGVMRGEFAMSGLRVANPEGYTGDHFLTLGEGEVSVSLGTLREEVVELPRLALSGIDLVLEKGAGGSNYEVIIDHLKSLRSGDDTAPKDKEAGGKRFVIREVTVKDVHVEAQLMPVGGSLTSVRVPIEQITLTDVGTGGGNNRGVSMSQLSGVIVEAILAAVAANAADLPGDLANDLGGAVGELGGLAEMGIGATFKTGDGVVRGVLSGDPVKALEEVGGLGEDVTKGVGDAIGGLLGGKKEKKDE